VKSQSLFNQKLSHFDKIFAQLYIATSMSFVLFSNAAMLDDMPHAI
jgi:hypothetical protein